MNIVIRSTFPGRRRNSPRAETLCSDLSNLTSVPASLFVADEAGITVRVDDERPVHVHALAAINADGEFDDRVQLVGTLPHLGTIHRSHTVDLSGTVHSAIRRCTLDLAVGIAEVATVRQLTGRIVVVDHVGEPSVDATF